MRRAPRPARRITRTFAALAVALGAWTIGLAAGLPVVAQDRGTIHISIGAGERQGEIDVPDPFCLAGYYGPASWSVSITQTPEVADLLLSLGSGFDTLMLLLGDYEYQLYGEEANLTSVQIDDRGSSATLTVQASMTSPGEQEPIPVTVVIECTVLDRSFDMPWPSGVPTAPPPTPQPTELLPTLAPVQLGTPAPGSTTFHLVLDSGPDAGSFDVWTLSNACRRLGEIGWLVQYADAATTPSTISVLMLADVQDKVGTVTFGFGAGPDARTYTAVLPSITLEDGTAAATIQASGEARGSGDGTPVGFELHIECPAVGS